jgi:hypothetical protein
MKIQCQCGAIISDQTDNLPHKGHLIPDQEWIPVHDGIDAVIEDVAAGRMKTDAASMKIRSLIGTSARFAYQCKECGQLFVNDRQHQMHTFTPASDDTCREILRSRDRGADV